MSSYCPLAQSRAVWTLEGRSGDPAWKADAHCASFASPILLDGALYGLDMGLLACLDLETGKRHWKKGRFAHGQILLAGATLIVLGEKGELAFVAASPDEFRQEFLQPVLEGKTWNTPTLANGLLLVRNHLEAACFDLSDPAKRETP